MVINETYYNTDDIDIYSTNEFYITSNGQATEAQSSLLDIHITDYTIDIYNMVSTCQFFNLSKFINYHYDQIITINLYDNDEHTDFFYVSTSPDKICSEIKNWFEHRTQQVIGEVYSDNPQINTMLQTKRHSLCECMLDVIKSKPDFYDYLCEQMIFESNTDTTFGEAFKGLTDIIMKHTNLQFEELIRVKPEEGFISTPYIAKYIYKNNHTREFIIDKIENHLNDFKDGWHNIFFRFYSDNSKGSSEGAMTMYNNDVLISVNIFFITNRNSAELTLVHELTHSLGALSKEQRNILICPNKQFYKSIKDANYEPASSLSIIKDELLSFIDDEHRTEEEIIFNIISRCLYYFSVYEQNSFKEETSLKIRQQSAYRIKKFLKQHKAITRDDISVTLISVTFNENRLEKMHNIKKMIQSFDLQDENDIKQLCLFSYYINRTLSKEIKQSVIDKDNIIDMFNDYEQPDIKQLKIVHRQVMKFISDNIKLYVRKLKAEVLSAYDVVMYK